MTEYVEVDVPTDLYNQAQNLVENKKVKEKTIGEFIYNSVKDLIYYYKEQKEVDKK